MNTSTVSSSQNLSTSGTGSNFIPMTLPFQITSGCLIGVLTVLAVGGNILTIIAFATDKKLRSVYDFLIFNQAITDILIGAFSMPFHAVYTLKEFYWDFGPIFCKIYKVIDFTACAESNLSMVLLSLDRLALVTLGPTYSVKCTMFRAIICACISWVISFGIYGPAIIGWDYWVGYSTVRAYDCDVEFAYNFEYTTITAIAEFVIPVIGLSIINAMIYHKITERGKKLQSSIKNMKKKLDTKTTKPSFSSIRKAEKSPTSGNGSSSHIETRSTQSTDTLHELDIDNSDRKSISTLNSAKYTMTPSTTRKNGVPNNASVEPEAFSSPGCLEDDTRSGSPGLFHKFHKHLRRTASDTNWSFPVNKKTPNTKVDLGKIVDNNKEKSRLKRERKAARFLGVLVLVFLGCWAPYTIITIIISFCKSECVNTSVYEASLWLLMMNSSINPFLYALNSARYRYNFKKYFCCT